MVRLAVVLLVACSHHHPVPLGRPEPPDTAPQPAGPQPAPTATVIPPSPPLSTHARGKPVRVQLDLDDAASLQAAGFHLNAGGTSSFAGGTLTITTRTYEEWAQPAGGFVATAGDPPGWAIEARVRLLQPCTRPATGFWIHDGYHFLRVGITDHEIVVPDEALRADIGDTTSGFRTYRIASEGDSLTISVDGKQVISSAMLANDASITFMFGVLGDGCAVNSSAWDYVAYETYPAPHLAWPDGWHAGTTADLLLPALGPLAPKTVADADVPCLAILAVDGAVRDLLAVGYDQLPQTTAATQLRREKPLVDDYTRREIRDRIHEWITPRAEPVCDPAPGAPCGPRHAPPVPPSPSFTPTVLAALDAASRWADHPAFAYQATALAMKAYDEARAAHVPGADAAAHRLADKLAALATHPPHCGL